MCMIHIVYNVCMILFKGIIVSGKVISKSVRVSSLEKLSHGSPRGGICGSLFSAFPKNRHQNGENEKESTYTKMYTIMQLDKYLSVT